MAVAAVQPIGRIFLVSLHMLRKFDATYLQDLASTKTSRTRARLQLCQMKKALQDTVCGAIPGLHSSMLLPCATCRIKAVRSRTFCGVSHSCTAIVLWHMCKSSLSQEDKLFTYKEDFLHDYIFMRNTSRSCSQK